MIIAGIAIAIGFYALKTAAVALTAWFIVRIVKSLPCFRDEARENQRLDIHIVRPTRVIPRDEQILRRRNRFQGGLRPGLFDRPILESRITNRRHSVIGLSRPL